MPLAPEAARLAQASRAGLGAGAWSFLRLQPDLDKPAEGNFSSDCGVVLASYPRVNGVQVCFSPVNPGGHLSSLVRFLSFCIRGVTRRFELAHFDFTFSPSSTSRRMASGRVRPGSFCFDIHAAMAADCSGNTRRCTDSAPVDGLPRDFRVRVIDLPMNIMYQKSKPGGSWSFRPGSNPSHKGRKSNDPG